MESFEIKGDNGFLKIEIKEVFGFPNRTSHFGGYECRADIHIKIPSYQVEGNFYTSTGEIFKFYNELEKCQIVLKGKAEYSTMENNLEMIIKYNDLGRTEISGRFQQYMDAVNCLEFEINSDQSFIKNTLDELEVIVKKYGNMKGIIKD